MTVHRLRARAPAAVVASLFVLTACMSSPNERARFGNVATIETYPVAIVAVDGAKVPTGSAAMQPGARKVTVQMPAAAGFKVGDVRTIDLDVKPCTSYWLVAARDRTAGDEYHVKVDHEKRDAMCARALGDGSSVRY